MTLPITSAVNTAIRGLTTSTERVNKAAADINQAFTAAQNAQAADSVSVSDKAAAVPAVQDAMKNAVLPSGDITQPVVDMLQAVTAYKANAATLRVTADIDQTVIDMVGKK